MTDHDRAQLAALGARCARCGTPTHPRGGHGYTSAGYTCPPPDALAAVTAERDALRGALVALVTAEIARDAAELTLMVTGKREDIDRAEGLLDEAMERALETLARTGGQ